MSSMLWFRVRKVVLLMMSLAVLALMVGCGALDSTATLIVINNTGGDVCGVYAVDAAADTQGDWGENLLGDSAPLINGQNFELEIPDGTYDLHAETCDGGMADRPDQLMDGRVEWTLVPG